MTDIKGKALEMANAFLGTDHATLALLSHQELYFALVHVVEQNEAFRQEVSDAVGDTLFMVETHCDGEAVALVSNRLMRFIIPKPKPDPLEDVAESMGYYGDDAIDLAEEIRAALDALGFEIREKNDV